MPNIHKLIEGGDEYLPFALGREKALRRTGLKYVAQSYQIGGVKVRIRLEGEHSYISIKSTKPGEYTALPHSNAHPLGVNDNDKKPEAVIGFVDGAPKVKENKRVLTGRNDWRKGKDVLTYDSYPQRYRITGPGAARMGWERPNIYVGGTKVITDVSVNGGLSTFFVKGAGKITAEGESFYLIASNNYDSTKLFIAASKVGSGGWNIIGEVPIPSGYVASDPAYFSPDGTKFNTIIRTPTDDDTAYDGRKLSGTIAATPSTNGVTLAASGTVGGDLLVKTVWEPETGSVVNQVDGPTAVNLGFFENITTRSYYTTGGSAVLFWRVNAVSNVTQYDQVNLTRYKFDYTIPIAFDYSDTSEEIPVTVRVVVERESRVHTNYFAVEHGQGSSSSGTESSSGDTSGPYTDTESDPTADDRWHAAELALSEEKAALAYTETSLDETSQGQLLFGGTAIATVPWTDIKFSKFIQNNNTTYNGNYKFERHNIVAADARTQAIVVGEASCVGTLYEMASGIPAYNVGTRTLKLKAKHKASERELTVDVGSGTPFIPSATAPTYYHLLFGCTANGNYASRDGDTFVASITSAQGSQTTGFPARIESLVFITGDKNTPKALFSIGGEGQFDLSPISVF